MVNNIAAIPLELRNKPQWVCHKNKIPMNPHTYLAASSTDSSTWGTFDQAIKAAEVNGFDGVGFVFAAPYVGVDMDHCIENGEINEFARNVIEKCNSYTEISPSGEGIHIIVKGSIPRAFKSKGIEVYDQGRYFTVTATTVDPYRVIRTADLGFLFSEQTAKVRQDRATEDSWILRELNAIKKGEGETGRTPTFCRVIGSLKARGMKPDEVVAFLSPWSEKHEYGSERLAALVSDQFRRYPPLAETEPGRVDTEDDSVTSFLNDYQEVKWLIPGILADNTINLFVGLSESRKSWLLLDLAISFAAGVSWLNKFQCPKRKVLLIDQERPKAEMQRRLRALIKGRGLSPNSLEGYLLKPLVGTTIRIDLPQSFAALCKRIEASRPDVLLIDSFKAFQSKDIVSNYDMQMVMEKFKELRNKYGLTIGVIHHENKMGYSRNREGHAVTMEHVAGAGPVVEVAEGVFVVQNNDVETSMVHHVKNSYGTKVAPFMVRVKDTLVDKSAITVEAA